MLTCKSLAEKIAQRRGELRRGSGEADAVIDDCIDQAREIITDGNASLGATLTSRSAPGTPGQQ